MSMGGGFYRGLDDSAKNAAAVSCNRFHCLRHRVHPEWARHTLHKVLTPAIYLPLVGFWK
ncbi:hypothetical protein B0H65DRAFT_460889, partial [Neurospora tetraspora]